MADALCRNRLGVRLQGPRPKFARKDGGEGGSHPSNVHDHVYAIGTINFTGAPSGRLTPLLHAHHLAAAHSNDDAAGFTQVDCVGCCSRRHRITATSMPTMAGSR